MTSTCADCGWSGGPYRSQAQAAYALARHSCARHRSRAERAAKAAAVRAAVDRTPRPCLHKRTDHQHGTHACYVLDKCRCLPCSRANVAYERNRRRQQAYGRWDGLVSAAQARAHVLHLMDQGMGLKTIGTRARVSQSSLGKLLYGEKGRPPSKRIHSDTQGRLLAVTATLGTLADGAVINSIGTRRRMQALVAIGWSQSDLARRIGLALRNFNLLTHGRCDVTVKTAKAVADLYEQIWDTPPTIENRWQRSAYTRSLNYAHQHGFAPPMAWDDDTIDDPNAAPDAGAPPDARRSVHMDDLEHLAQAGYGLDAAAQRLGVKRDSVERAIARDGRPDVMDALNRNSPTAEMCRQCGHIYTDLPTHVGQAHRAA